MYKVMCTVPRNRVEKFGSNSNPDFEFHFMDPLSTDEELIEVGKDADIVFVSPMEFIRANVIEKFEKCKFIQSEGAGYDKIDVEAATKKNIPVSNSQYANSGATAEHTLALMLSLIRKVNYADKKIKNGLYNETTTELRSSKYTELSSRTVGIIGLGAVGKEVAKRLMPFGCKVYYYDIIKFDEELEKSLNVEFMDYEDIYKVCNLITYHVPVKEDTVKMFNEETLAQMPEDIIIVNAARGEILDQELLAKCLESGRVQGAALDAIAPEPAPKDHPILILSDNANDRLVITPHIGGTTEESFFRIHGWVRENMESVIKGEKPRNLVNDVKI